VGKRYADARNSGLRADVNGNPDARFGQLGAYFVVGLSAFYEVAEGGEVFARVSNLFDEDYIASTLPLGPRAGASRLYRFGYSQKF